MKKILFTSLFIISFLALVCKSYAENNLFGFHDIEVVSPSKQEEPLFSAASSIYVITGDDIKRSGADNVAESLRLIPGMEVARADSNKWSISSRGFGRLYDNKILVLLDGREIYSSIYNGQSWSDLQGIIIEDIDRIEVIRGPSSALWGANTSNGIINIITKNPRYTQGFYFDTKLGSKYYGSSARYGSSNKDGDIFWRIYSSKEILGNSKSVDNLRGKKGDAGDDWGISRAGLKVNWQKDIYNELLFNIDINKGDIDQIILLPSVDNGFSDNQKFNGYSFDALWKSELSERSSLNSKIYFDKIRKNSLLGKQERRIFNFDINYFIDFNKFLKLKSGLGYRNINDKLGSSYINNTLVRSFTSPKQNNNLFSSFLEATIAVIPNKLDLILGSKIEDHFYTGLYHMPTAKARYFINDDNIIWSSYSKNARQPSRLENSLTQLSSYNGAYLQYNKDFKAEDIDSYELGYRRKIGKVGQFNISSFINQYDYVRTFELTSDQIMYQINNKLSAEVKGFDADININLTTDWNMVLGYRYLDVDFYFASDSNDFISKHIVGVSPRNLFQLQSRFNVNSKLQLDNYLYYYDALKTINVDSYIRFDSRISWEYNKNLDIEFIGRSLFNNYNQETTKSFFSTRNELGRSLQINLKWRWNNGY